MSKDLYDSSFFEGQSQNSYLSATEYAKRVAEILRPSSVVDLGCGVGTWLKAFAEQGAIRLVGIDGPWVDKQNLVDDEIEFIPHDLNSALSIDHERFDLAICMETAEHLRKESSSTVVSNLVSLSDVVIFSAAYSHQGGTNHINEQRHSYWASIFIENGYIPYDFFRPIMWGNESVEFWYQQNAFLFVKSGAIIAKRLEQAAAIPITNLEFMNCVHPDLYDRKVRLAQLSMIPRTSETRLPPKGIMSFARSLRRRYLESRAT